MNEVYRCTVIDGNIEVDTIMDTRGSEYRWAQRYRHPRGEWSSWACCRGSGSCLAATTVITDADAVAWIEGGE